MYGRASFSRSWRGGEVGVQQQDVVAVRHLEAEPEVSGLLEPAAVRPPGVGETELAGHRLQLGAGRVVQHIGGDRSLIVAAHLGHVFPGIADHVHWFTAYRKENVHRRIGLWPPAAD